LARGQCPAGRTESRSRRRACRRACCGRLEGRLNRVRSTAHTSRSRQYIEKPRPRRKRPTRWPSGPCARVLGRRRRRRQGGRRSRLGRAKVPEGGKHGPGEGLFHPVARGALQSPEQGRGERRGRAARRAATRGRGRGPTQWPRAARATVAGRPRHTHGRRWACRMRTSVASTGVALGGSPVPRGRLQEFGRL